MRKFAIRPVEGGNHDNKIILQSPLFTDWTEQYVRLKLDAVVPSALTVNGVLTPFQYTGNGAEIIVRLGFATGESKELVFTSADRNATDLAPVSLPLGMPIGVPGRELTVTQAAPFAGFAGFPFASRIHCEQPFERAMLTRTNDGPLFTEYLLRYEFAEQRHYTLQFRCFKLDPYIEVSEHFALGMNAEMVWTWAYNLKGDGEVESHGGPPRTVVVSDQCGVQRHDAA